jgi:hypothetical protein
MQDERQIEYYEKATSRRFFPRKNSTAFQPIPWCRPYPTNLSDIAQAQADIGITLALPYPWKPKVRKWASSGWRNPVLEATAQTSQRDLEARGAKRQNRGKYALAHRALPLTCRNGLGRASDDFCAESGFRSGELTLNRRSFGLRSAFASGGGGWTRSAKSLKFGLTPLIKERS